MKRFFGIVLTVIAVVVFTGIWSGSSATVEPAQLEEINQQWQQSAHALAEVNCSSCHLESETEAFISCPTEESCRSCHEQQVETFLLGKHGIRTLEGLQPLTPKMAELPMKKDAQDKVMSCNTCHDVHSTNTMVASVDSCLTCHDDTHSLLYENSKHAELFVEEGELPRPSAQSVTCATCHLPRQVHEGATFVNHNNTFTLLPRDRMVGEVCINCHGVEYSYNSVFDDELVQANFDQEPSLEMETFELVRALEERRSGGKKQKPKVEQSQQKPQPQPEQLRPLESLTEAELFAVQEALYNAGFDVVVDGLYGPGTAIALEEFQLQNGIDEAGKVGSKTRTALGL